jgi:hypothetical protein
VHCKVWINLTASSAVSFPINSASLRSGVLNRSSINPLHILRSVDTFTADFHTKFVTSIIPPNFPPQGWSPSSFGLRENSCNPVAHHPISSGQFLFVAVVQFCRDSTADRVPVLRMFPAMGMRASATGGCFSANPSKRVRTPWLINFVQDSCESPESSFS